MKTLQALFIILLMLCVASRTRAADTPPVTAARGITEPFLDVILSASVPGIISALNFKEGQTVARDEIIYELDKRLEELETQRRQLVVDLRKADLESTRLLFSKTTAVSKEEVEKKDVDYKVAAVEHEMASEQLRRRQVAAPFAGVITELFPEVGEAVQSYQPMARLVDTQQCYFVSNVEARAGAQLKLAQPVTIEIDTGRGTAILEGKVVFLSPVVDPGSGLLKVKALFNNADGKVRPGLSGRMLFN